MPVVSVRPLVPADLGAVVELNNAAVPAVTELDTPSARHLTSLSGFHLVAESAEGGVIAFLITLDRAGLDYDSVNYGYFADKHPAGFLYVDRVVVGSPHRSLGLGERLYEQAIELDARRSPVMCAEVYLWPPNTGSLRFHRRLGFDVVGEQDNAEDKRVVMLERQLSQGHGAGEADR